MTITKEGSLASFYTVNKAPIKHLKVYFSLKQAGEGTPSPENVREISGRTGIEFTHCGKNMFYFDSNKIITMQNSNGDNRPAHLLPPFTGHTITFSRSIKDTSLPATSFVNIYRYNDTTKLVENFIYPDTPQKVITYTFNSTDAVFINSTNSIAALTNNITRYNVQIEVGSVATTYEPYRGQTYTLDWNNDIGTIYGGYIDLITGELVQTHYCIDIPSQQLSTIKKDSSTDSNFVIQVPRPENSLPQWKLGIINVMSNRFSPTLPSGTIGRMATTAGGIYCILPLAELSENSINAAKAWFNNNPTQIVYTLETPIIHQLSPTQLFTLIGRNNIWSNADKVEIEYDLAESNDELYRRRNIILRNSPHLESVYSGNTNDSDVIAHFTTNMPTNVKSLTASFSPIQEGNGTPSPSNVRPISGWTGLEIIRCGRNFVEWGQTPRSGVSYSVDYSVLDGTVIANGTTTNAGIFIRNAFTSTNDSSQADGIKHIPNGDYYITSFGNATMQVCANDVKYGTNSTLLFSKKEGNLTIDDTYKFNWIRIHNSHQMTYNNETIYPSIFLQSEPDKTFEKGNFEHVLINWSSTAGTIYGGYIDLTNGELVKTHDLCVMDGVTSQKMFSTKGGVSTSNPWSNNYYFQFEAASLLDRSVGWIPADILSSNSIFSNYFPNHDGNGITITDISFGAYIGSNGTRFQPRIMWPYSTTEFDTVEKANNWLKEQYDNGTPFSFSYKLKTPIHYQLTPQSLRTLRGTNNIWSTANGPIEISYWTH